MAECRQRAAETLREGRPTNWLAAGAIIGVWIVLTALFVVIVIRLLAR